MLLTLVLIVISEIRLPENGSPLTSNEYSTRGRYSLVQLLPIGFQYASTSERVVVPGVGSHDFARVISLRVERRLKTVVAAPPIRYRPKTVPKLTKGMREFYLRPGGGRDHRTAGPASHCRTWCREQDRSEE